MRRQKGDGKFKVQVRKTGGMREGENEKQGGN